MNKIIPLILCVLSLASCSNISEDERLIYVEPATVNKAVLIEDFTGQRCINCPTAHEEIAKMQEQYGKENVIAVSIHSGPLAVYSNGRITGLRTQLGDDYYDYWNVEAEPTGLINRKGGVASLDKWQTAVYEELQEKSDLKLALSTEALQGNINIGLMASVAEPVNGKLQLWVVEDSIAAPQMMPDGTINMEYMHQHVLRSAVNGDWGTDINWQSGEQELSFTTPIEDGWIAENLSVIAFVYDDKGIIQVTASRLFGKINDN